MTRLQVPTEQDAFSTLPLILGAGALRGAARVAPAAAAAARTGISRAVGGIGRALRRAFGAGSPEASDSQAMVADTSNQDVNVPLAMRTASYGKPADTVDTIARMGITGPDRGKQDVGESLSGGNVISILSSIDKNVEAITSYILSGRGGTSSSGGARQANIGRSSAISQGTRTDMLGLAAGAGLGVVGQLLNNDFFNNNTSTGTPPSTGPSVNNTSTGTPPSTGPSVDNIQQSDGGVRVSNDVVAQIQRDLDTPEPNENDESRSTRENLSNQLNLTFRGQRPLNVNGTFLESELNRDITQYLEGRAERGRSNRAPGSVSGEPQSMTEQSTNVDADSEYRDRDSLNQIIEDYERLQGRSTEQPSGRGNGDREVLPLQEREPTPRNNRRSQSGMSSPSAFSSALSTAVPRFSLSNAMDVITGRNLSRSRAANAIDNEYTSNNLNPAIATPTTQQAPTIINNNNITQGGGQSQPNMSAATGTPSMPAGSGVPPIIGTYPTPPSSPAFNNYSN